MRWQLGVAIVCVGLGSVGHADEKPVDDQKQLQGLWLPTGIEVAGKKLPADAPPVKELRILIKGDRLVFNPDHKTQPKREMAFTIDPKASPKAIDLSPVDGPRKGKVFPAGIYVLEGDALTVCLDEKQLEEGKPGKRPTEFKTKEGDGQVIFYLKRSK